MGFYRKRKCGTALRSKKFTPEDRKNKFLTVVSPKDDNNGNALWVHQQTYFNLGNFESGEKITYNLHKEGHGAYIFLISGELKIGEQMLGEKDAMGVWETNGIDIEVTQEAKVLLIEVPMN